jgi:hypothetical protein
MLGKRAHAVPGNENRRGRSADEENPTLRVYRSGAELDRAEAPGRIRFIHFTTPPSDEIHETHEMNAMKCGPQLTWFRAGDVVGYFADGHINQLVYGLLGADHEIRIAEEVTAS